jgi:hypothetical protein
LVDARAMFDAIGDRRPLQTSTVVDRLDGVIAGRG